MNKTEILSPAGGIEEFYAAINSGADAVYTGLKLYSARKNAKNLEIDELREIVSYAHLIGKKVYVTLNTMLFNEEIENLISILPEIFSFLLSSIAAAIAAPELMPTSKPS